MVLHDARYGNYEISSRICVLRTMPFEDHIRELCARAVVAPQGDLEPILLDLQAALHEHTENLRLLAAKVLVGEGTPRA
jgi:hypothetical protein